MKEEFIEMAKKAGFPFWSDEEWAGDRKYKIDWVGTDLDIELNAFAQMVYEAGVQKGRQEKNIMVMFQEKVDEVLLEFDFGKVQKTMTALEWKWSGVQPTIQMLKDHVTRLMKTAVEDLIREEKDEWNVVSGGFEVCVFSTDEGVNVTLKFVVTNWSTYW